jgi:hypothetical protein
VYRIAEPLASRGLPIGRRRNDDIQLDCQTPPPPALTEFLALVAKRLQQKGIRFVVNLMPGGGSYGDSLLTSRCSRSDAATAVFPMGRRRSEGYRAPKPASHGMPSSSDTTLVNCSI